MTDTSLKMLGGQYFDNLIIGHTFYSMLSTLHEITLQKEWLHAITNNEFLTKNVPSQQQQHKKRNINPYHNQESNPEPLAPQSAV